MPLYLQESLRIEVLMMIGYGEKVRKLPPISQGTVSKIYAQYWEGTLKGKGNLELTKKTS
ncbi:hypothetical protein NQ315_000674 [Exocentrus adspersus]|uniref:Uncharacterized protein n=1 Tax=Exocentrus adspersus TaxID=1586481 RepID=A0AAV8VN28_9CUCU|nr:hypothetical protein NQ315_000674 [Exocentrus adspersus]